METFTDDTVVALASFLSPHDMLSLALSCKRFGDKHGMDKKRSAARDESTREVRQRIETISLMEVAAHTVLHAKWTEEEENALPRRGDESWIGIYQEFLKLFHYPLQFDKLVGQCNYVDSTDKTIAGSLGYNADTAICSNIMRAGKHSVSFQVNDKYPLPLGGISCGIMRPTTKDITSLESCHPTIDDLSRFSLKDYGRLHCGNVDCCLLCTRAGNGSLREKWKGYYAVDVDEEEEVSRYRLLNADSLFGKEGKKLTTARSK